MYYCDVSEVEGTILAIIDLDVDQMDTVNDIMEKHNQRQIKEAKVARYYQNTVGISTRSLLKSIDSGSMRNSPVTREAVKIAQDIWGVSRPYL